MRLPVNFLLYLTSLGLLGQAGYNFYLASPQLGAKKPEVFTTEGNKEAAELLKRGRRQDAGKATVDYTKPIWARFKTANLTGKLPPPPKDPLDDKPPEPVKPVQTPLEDIIELVELWYESPSKGTAGTTHITVRYKPEAQVQPPEDEQRRRQLARGGEVAGGPRDVSNIPAAQAPERGGNRRGRGPATPLPTAPASEEWVQYLTPGESLWGQYKHIKLVRVSEDAESAFFVREGAAAEQGSDAKPAEEELAKLATGLTMQVMKALAAADASRSAANPGAPAIAEPPRVAAPSNRWVDVEETFRKDNNWNIGRKDLARFRNADDALAGVGLDDYVSKSGSLRGVVIVNVDPKLSSYGFSPGEVILAVNGEPVKTRSEAINIGKKQYQRGTRTFTIRVLDTTGQIVERTYQAPDKD